MPPAKEESARQDQLDERGLRLAEVVAALSLASDLGTGHPLERSLRACLLAVQLGAALGMGEFAPLRPNPVAEFLATQPPREFVQLLLILLPQLLGEELLTMLPFLAILQLTASHWGRRSSIGLALLGSTLLFSAGHLPTYDWNWAQCFGVIGAARVVWTLAYIATRSLWVSIGAHILTDGVAIMLAFLDTQFFLWAI